MTRPHLSFAEILDVTEGRVVAETARAHVRSCEACRSVAEGVERLLATMAHAANLPEVPADVRARALSRLEAELALTTASAPNVGSILRALVERLGDEVRLLTAALVGDSLQASHATRAGAEITAAPRMLLYETEAYDITISLAPSAEPSGLDISGQITPRAGELAAGGAAGVRVGDFTGTAELSEYGEFSFESVPTGDLELEVGVGSSVIRLAPIPRPEIE